MKIIFAFILSLHFSAAVFAQTSPKTYLIGDELKSLGKVEALNPTSNTIIDIITIGDTVWLGTSRGVSVSFDRGENWINFYGSPDFGTDNVSAIGYNNGVFWAATARSVEQTGQTLPQGTGLKFTTDNGQTWTSVPQPLDGENDNQIIYGINTLQALPVTVAVQNLAYDIAFTPGTIWIATFAGGLRKSIDNGQTWSRVVLPPDNLNSIKPTDTLNFCLSPVGGNFCSTGNLNHRVFAITTADDSTIYVGTANGINKSTDGGISWVKFNHQNQSEPISGNFITALGYNNFNNTVWASTWKAEDENEFYGVSSSENGGMSWSTFLRDERPHNFGFKNNQVMVATDNGIFRSTDKGTSWLLPNAIVDNTTGASIRTNIFFSASAQGNDVWVGSDNGLARLRETVGRIWEGTWKVYLAAQPLTSAEESYCYPNPFSPRQEELKIKYSTGGTDANVTIRIFDFGFNYVRTIIQNAPRNRSLESPPDYWDGRDEAGSVVPNGVYFYRIDVDDKDPVYGKILVLQ